MPHPIPTGSGSRLGQSDAVHRAYKQLPTTGPSPSRAQPGSADAKARPQALCPHFRHLASVQSPATPPLQRTEGIGSQISLRRIPPNAAPASDSATQVWQCCRSSGPVVTALARVVSNVPSAGGRASRSAGLNSTSRSLATYLLSPKLSSTQADPHRRYVTDECQQDHLANVMRKKASASWPLSVASNYCLPSPTGGQSCALASSAYRDGCAVAPGNVYPRGCASASVAHRRPWLVGCASAQLPPYGSSLRPAMGGAAHDGVSRSSSSSAAHRCYSVHAECQAHAATSAMPLVLSPMADSACHPDVASHMAR